MTLTDAPASTNGTAPRDATDAKLSARLDRARRIATLRDNGWRVELSGGQWATLRDPDTVTERQIQPLKLAQARTAVGSADESGQTKMTMDHEAVIRAGYVLVATFLASWSLEAERPTAANLDPLLDLSSRDYARLQTACEDLGHEAMEDYSPTPEATSPFVASSD